MSHESTDSRGAVSSTNSTSVSAECRSANLEKRLAAYAVAGITGASLFAASPDAEAKVVYTSAHVVISHGTTYDLDLNNDGLTDFVLSNTGTALFQGFGISPQSHLQGIMNEGVCIENDLHELAAPAALAAGVEIGHQRNFQPYGPCMRNNSSSDVQGHWQSVTNRYLGLAFLINGEIHYGWARLNTLGARNFHAVLTGYAYESVAYKSIVTGDEGGAADAAVPASGTRGSTLGELAVGAAQTGR